jgi:predicted O-linked N-acetylglucosamine transferase (SPINDLY family)
VSKAGIDALLNKAAAQQRAGHVGEAVADCRRAIELKPKDAVTFNRIGMILSDCGEIDQAVRMYRRALELNPRAAVVEFNMGNALARAGRAEEARAAYQRAADLQPDLVPALVNLAALQQGAGQSEEAIATLRRGLRVRPNDAAVHNNLGLLLWRKGQYEEARAEFLEAIRSAPNHPSGYANLCLLLREHGEPDAALGYGQKGVALGPNSAEAHANLGVVYKDLGQIDRALALFARAAELEPGNANHQSNRLFNTNLDAGYDSAAILRDHVAWAAKFAEPLRARWLIQANDRNPDRRLRIGYVSPDLRGHVIGLYLLPVLRRQDHSQFEIFAYNNASREDSVSAELRRHSDHWQHVFGVSDEKLAERIVADGIDILIDLALHTAHGRPMLFARKPAPVQVQWLAYPGTSGLSAIDWRLTDPYLDPPGEHDDWYSEKSWRLPHSFWCYEGPADAPAVNELPALAAGHVTFGCLNNFTKVSDATLARWAGVMTAVPRSRLLLMAPVGSAREHALTVLKGGGIEESRVDFVGQQQRGAYLENYHRIDIGLDTLPYNGHTTSLDSFWMGVQVVTLVGRTVVGRAGFSQLMNLGMPELVARSEEDFVRIAAGLAADLSRLAAMRAGLRDRMRKSPLTDAAAFARDIEAAYRAMWRQWCGAQADAQRGGR